VQEPLNLRKEVSKTFGSLRLRIRKLEKLKVKEKEKNFSLTDTKKLINITNSPAAAPKT